MILDDCEIWNSVCRSKPERTLEVGLVPVLHRLDRVLIFFSSRPNWESPTSSHADECVPPLWFRRGAHSLAGEGVGVSQFGRGDRHCGTLRVYVLFAVLIKSLTEGE
jgi:hypothetical protein